MTLVILVISLPAVLIVAGAVLTLTALFGRRRGETPFCRKCRYNLTGIDADRCPECGWSIVGRGVVRGERPSRRARLVVGVSCLLISAAAITSFAIATARGVDWYAVAPNELLLAAIPYVDDEIATECLGELSARFLRDTLGEKQTDQLIESCLREQGRPALRPGVGQLAGEIVSNLVSRGVPSDDQRGRFFENLLFDSEIEARAAVIAGRACPVRTVHDFRARVPDGYEVLLRQSAYYTSSDISKRQTEWPEHYYVSSVFECLPIDKAPSEVLLTHEGTAEIKSDLEFYLFRIGTESPTARTWQDNAIYTRAWTLRRRVTVLPPDSPPTAVGRHTAVLDERVRSLVKLKVAGIGKAGYEPGAYSLVLVFDIGLPRPVDLAFEATVETETDVFELEDVSVSRFEWSKFAPPRNYILPKRNSGGIRTVVSSSLRPRSPTEFLVHSTATTWKNPSVVNVRLRGSADVAMRSIEATEYWDGELRFDNVPVHDDAIDWGEPRYGRVVRD